MDNKQNKEFAVLQNLEDAGCEKHLIMEYLQYEKKGLTQQQLCLLAKYRKTLLERIHEEQFRLDCLDYLINNVKAGNRREA